MAELARAAGARADRCGRDAAALARPSAGDLPGERAGVRRLSRTRCASFDFAPNRGSVFSAHQMGTVRMGAADDHPDGSRGRVRCRRSRQRSIRGLYVADGSLFPTGIGVNPMITIMALARRVARTIVAERCPERPIAAPSGPRGGSLVDRSRPGSSPAPGSGGPRSSSSGSGRG